MKIALFGGSFDPVHQGHLTVAQEAYRRGRFDRFFFVPAALSPFKHPGSVSASLRLRMLEDALKEVPCLPAEIDRSEISRGAPSYSVDTIRCIRGRFPGAAVTWIGGFFDFSPQRRGNSCFSERVPHPLSGDFPDSVFIIGNPPPDCRRYAAGGSSGTFTRDGRIHQK